METFRIFCVIKNEPTPKGSFDPEEEPEHFSKAEMRKAIPGEARQGFASYAVRCASLRPAG